MPVQAIKRSSDVVWGKCILITRNVRKMTLQGKKFSVFYKNRYRNKL